MAGKKRKFSLVRAFTKAVLGIVAVATLAYGAWLGIFYAGKGEPLTQGESAIAASIFGDQLDTDRIRKHNRPEGHITHVFRWAQGTVPPPTSHIDLFGDWARGLDFSAGKQEHMGFLLHEITHTWQGQNLRLSLHNIGRYDYQPMLTERSRFSDFGTEQQGDLVQDYYSRWIHPDAAKLDHTHADMQVRRVVEEQFPQARITRERLERERAEATSASTPAPAPPRPA